MNGGSSPRWAHPSIAVAIYGLWLAAFVALGLLDTTHGRSHELIRIAVSIGFLLGFAVLVLNARLIRRAKRAGAWPPARDPQRPDETWLGARRRRRS